MFGVRCRKGSAEAVAVALATLLLLSALFYSLYTLTSIIPRSRHTSFMIEYIGEELILFQVNETDRLSLGMKNTGSLATSLRYVIVIDKTDLSRYIINLDKESACYASLKIVPPGDMSIVTCKEPYVPIAVITERGHVYSIDARLYAMQLERFLGLPMTTVYGGVNVTSTSSLLQFIENTTLIYQGALNTTLRFNNIEEFYNTLVRGVLNATFAIIGQNPSNQKLNILIIGYGLNIPDSYIEIRNATSGQLVRNISIPTIGGLRYRVKIENFTGVINVNIGILPCYINTNSTCRITINGSADRVVVYGASTNSTGLVGFDPYLYVGDVDGNGNVEIIYITQDFNINNSTAVNDLLRVGMSTLIALDSNYQPLRIVFTNIPIRGDKYSSAVLSIKMFYWDNSLDDISDNDNRIIVRVGLYDPSTNTFVYSTYLSYYELNRYRNVKPFGISHVVKDFVVHIPPLNKEYYVAFEILDAFHADGTRNDADIVVGLEYIGLILSLR